MLWVAVVVGVGGWRAARAAGGGSIGGRGSTRRGGGMGRGRRTMLRATM